MLSMSIDQKIILSLKNTVKSISTFCISVTMVTEKFNGVHGTYIADQTCYEW